MNRRTVFKSLIGFLGLAVPVKAMAKPTVVRVAATRASVTAFTNYDPWNGDWFDNMSATDFAPWWRSMARNAYLRPDTTREILCYERTNEADPASVVLKGSFHVTWKPGP